MSPETSREARLRLDHAGPEMEPGSTFFTS